MDGRKIRNKEYIPVVTKKEISRVFTEDILYIEKNLRIVNIYTYGRIYSFYGKLNGISAYLGENFYKCHSSCIINLNKISRIEDGTFFFEGGVTLRIGQNNYQHTRKRYSKFLEENL